MTTPQSTSSDHTPFNLQEQLMYYLGYWKWFLICSFLGLVIAYAYLRYSTPIYRASTTILVKDDKKGGLDSELSAFSEIGLIKGVKSNVSNEIEILKSRTLVERAVSRLGLHITYGFEGLIKSGQAYPAPIQLVVIDSTTFVSNKGYNFTVKSVGANTFDLFTAETKLGRFKYADTIVTEAGVLAFVKSAYPNPKYKEPTDAFEFQVKINPLESVVQSYRGRLTVKTVNEDVNVVELAITDPVQNRAVDFLDMLVTSYIEDAIADKNLISQKTSQFINDRLELITNELDGVEKDFEGYKRTNRITDIPTEAQLFLADASVFEKQVLEVETQLRVTTELLSYLRKSRPEDVLPGTLSTDAGASDLIGQYNRLVLDRNRILRSSTPENPAVVALENRITSLKESVENSLLQLQNSLQIRKRSLNAQENKIGGSLAKVPTQEREFKIIDRQQKIKESLYLYLLQKREETAISLAVTAPNAKIIDKGYSSKSPISPKRNIVYLVGLFLGLIIPFAVLYLLQLLDTKVKSRLDIESKTSVPFLGDIPNSPSNNKIINFNSRSSAAEAIRIVRTNLEFLLSHVTHERAKTVFLTSTLPKEGKTFVSINLAGTIALSEKKVLLIGMDLRNPKIQDYINVPINGVTNYLSSATASIQDYIIKIEGYADFYVLPSGIIPPNPAELLMGKKVGEMFEQLKQEYDYIIVDTAPVSLVTDPLLIAHFADAFIYVVRANYLDKRLLQVPEQLYQEQKLPNMSILLNDTDVSKGYGYGYGYGYGPETAVLPWYRRFFNF